MRFSFRQLEYFVAAGETGSVTRAAQGSHSSQPTVSAAIAKLEASLGVQLFVRHHAQGLSVTPAGREFAREAGSVLRHAAELASLWQLWEPQAADYVTRALDPAAAPSYGVPGDEG